MRKLIENIKDFLLEYGIIIVCALLVLIALFCTVWLIVAACNGENIDTETVRTVTYITTGIRV